ncbi:MAG: GNAT family N-acetyltransferase, partial [Rhizobiaceae bacterium]
MTGILIRPERPDDVLAIHDLTKRAFAPMPFAAGDEQDLIDTLRAIGDLTLSLMAEIEGKIVGHIAFSPASASDGSQGWFALGPIAVEPELQRRGIGKSLMADGLAHLHAMNASGCILVGNPDYYQRFGFRPFPHLAPDNEPAEYFMILPMGVAE